MLSDNHVKGEHLAKLLVAGNCNIIIQSLKSGDCTAFNIKKVQDYQVRDKWGKFCVRCDGKILGYIKDDKYVFYPPDKKLTKDQEVFKWLWTSSLKPELLDKNIKIFHTGKCAHCNRPLTDPVSIAIGIGPECLKNLT